MTRDKNKKKPPAVQQEKLNPRELNTEENKHSNHPLLDTASAEIKKYLHDLIEEFKDVLLIQVRQDIKKLIKEMTSPAQENTDGRTEEIRKEREASEEEFKHNLEYMKQIQREYQETQNSIEYWQNALTETKDNLLKLEERFRAYERERKSLLKITRNQKEAILKLEDDKKIHNLRIKNVSEEAGTSKNEIQKIFTEILKQNFPRIAKRNDIQIKEAYRTPATYNQNRSTPRHIIIEIPEIHQKNRILKAARERMQVTYNGKSIKITADLSTQTLKSRREWGEIFQVLKEKNMQPKFIYPSKLSLKINEEIRYFQDKEELWEFVATNPTLQRALKDITEKERKRYQDYSYSGREASVNGADHGMRE
ncbi:UDP-GlcNAc:betaGal beta-1,3-N-acetylglucosaminyltransferase-like protein 1 isoform X3 [Cavia porcellus]|uniref:UDP-GlcNAc:betaGal beta-1,3-N-acetylglucosaminyltransferase-like protein 1 isoform X3 n=1 Tax=Cavia porcellus TaxID=10141 RepID=UPI002FE0473E